MSRPGMWLAAFTLICLPRCAPAQSKPTPQQAQFFESKIRPLLSARCFRCHGEKKQRGGLRLDSRAAILAGGDRGPVLVTARPEQSLLFKAIQYTLDLKMPPSRKLSAEHIADIRRWIQFGAPWPGSDASNTLVKRKGEFKLSQRDRMHWSFQPLKRPMPPRVTNTGWLSNPIDAFILAGLEAKGLHPNPPAAKQELIRRVYYDLIGLAPTPAEVEAFVNNASPRAYEDLIERLLASPGYGEKWGRYWLDLVRFAESNSYERDDPKPNAWRYRDYVIRAFNQDTPYTRFLMEQLAGDELPDADTDAIIATGYYRLGIWDDEPIDREQARYDGLDDIVVTTGQVFLGLTVDCARCHDHKIDPIPQKDYYRLLAFFQNINHYRNGGPTDEVRLVTNSDGRRSFAYLPVGPSPKGSPGERILCVTESGGKAPETFVLSRGNPQAKGEKVEPGFPLVLGGEQAVVPPPGPGARSSGRRLALARWLARADNPLTARVMVNRIWQQHFGRGIVRTPNDFGLQGARPTHPELLDWLATEFSRRGWSLKAIHRLILTSSTYRMSSRAERGALAIDPNNDCFWRFDMRRLTAEEIRDSILAVSGNLNPKMYGPGIYPELSREVLYSQSMPGHGWGKSSFQEQNRRSVYIHVKRSLLVPILESFDLAETDRTTPTRFSTTQPTQALAMLNSSFLRKQSVVFAGRLTREAGQNSTSQVRRALYLATSRPPTRAEVGRGLGLIQALEHEDGISPQTALEYFCLMVLNLNEFVYLD